jgi:hypothetical protein
MFPTTNHPNRILTFRFLFCFRIHLRYVGEGDVTSKHYQSYFVDSSFACLLEAVGSFSLFLMLKIILTPPRLFFHFCAILKQVLLQVTFIVA